MHRDTFARIVGIVVASCWLLALTAGLPAAAQGPQPAVLARVELAGGRAPSGLPVYATLADGSGTDYALAIASPARLAASALRHRVLDTNATSADYLVAHTWGRAADTPEARAASDTALLREQGFSVVYHDGEQAIVRARPGDDERLAEFGFELLRLSPEPLPPAAPAAPSAPAIITPDPIVAGMIAQVTPSLVSDYDGGLSSEHAVTIGGAPYTITTRNTRSGTPIQMATQYVYEFMQARGLSPTYHYWDATTSGCSNTQGRNVVGEKPGKVHPNEIVLVTGHLDDMPSSGLAPGADDNGSGSTGVMALANLMSQHDFNRTVRFVFFTGEEQGLCGAAAYAALVHQQNQNIVGVYNMDMIGWDSIGGPTLRLHTRTTSNPGYPGDRAIANLFVDVVYAYGMSSALTPIIDPDGISASDHYEFWQQGYPAILAIEDDVSDFCAYYHTSNDKLQYLNLAYFSNYVKASLGTAAHLAGVYHAPNLQISKTAAPAPVIAGTRLNYNITVANAGGNATGVTIRDPLPANVQFASATSGGVFDGTEVKWSGLSIANGASIAVSFGVTVTCVTTGTQIVNHNYQVTASELLTPAVGSDVLTRVITQAVAAGFSTPSPIIAGVPFTFTNTSQNATHYVWDFGDGSTSTLFNPGHTYPATGTYLVTLTAGDACSSDTSGQTLTVDKYGVAIGPGASARHGKPGETVVHTLSVTNTGTLAETFSVALGPHAWYARPGTATIGPVAPGASASAQVSVTIPESTPPGASDQVEVVATVIGDPRPAPASAASLLATTADVAHGLRLTPSSAEASCKPGNTVTYTLRITNTGNVFDNVALSHAPSAWEWALPAAEAPLQPGEGRDVAVTAQVSPIAPADYAAVDVVTVTSSHDAGIFATARLTVSAEALYNLSLAANVTSAVGRQGTTVEYTLTVTNLSNTAATFAFGKSGAAWPVDLPPDLDLAVDESKDVTATVHVPPGAASQAIDMVTVTASSTQDPAAAQFVTLTTTAWRRIYLPFLTLR